ncbi:hypothetical protein [Pseudophaeobacter sp.]|uniref:hypothetical protein n=1 Tax=Pseudophaeobacter sp. TaxID=1971739 RepID=UPI0032970994
MSIRILVPTWMPKPPVYPVLEQPGLLVRLPEGATHPVSQRINGDTWAGTERRYRIYPLEPASFSIPEQALVLTYADDRAQPQRLELPMARVDFQAQLPEGATDMTPPVILANDLTLQQDWTGAAELEVGDAVTRTVTAQIDGTTAILLPLLIPGLAQPAAVSGDESAPLFPLKPYAKDPVLHDEDTRASLSGQRREEITYLAQAGGTALLEPIEIQWFNLKTETVETARLEGKSFQVAEPPPPPLSRQELLLRLLAMLLALGIMAILFRLLRPRLHQFTTELRQKWLGSPLYARRQVKRAIAAQELTQVMTALSSWQQFYPALDPEKSHALERRLAEIGRQKFHPGSQSQGKTVSASWAALAQEFKWLARHAKTQQRQASATTLPGLNP